MIAAVVRLSTNYTSQNTNAFISWDTVDYDDASFWSAGSPTRLTIPAAYTGWRVQVQGSAIWESTITSAYCEVKIFKNGVVASPVAVVQLSPNTANTAMIAQTHWLQATAGDYFTMALKTAVDEVALVAADYSILFSIALVRPG